MAVVARPGDDDYTNCNLSVPKPADKDSQEKKSSYRTRRRRDPWFDRLTTLSKVEGVSSEMLFFLDSGHPDAVGIPE